MLVELMVENYAVVERLRIRLGAGLNLLTGETGSGKSIIVDSLGLLFGGRADADAVRSGAERARITGIFEAPASKEFHELIEANGLEVEDGELLIEREILAGGKSRAFAGGRTVTAALLRDLAPCLGDIHGQHEQQRLFSAESQLDALDGFAGAGALREETGGIYRAWRETERELASLEKDEQEKLRLQDLWRFQRKEIEAAALRPGEEEELQAERGVLGNVTKLQEHAHAAYEAIYDAPEAALTRLQQARKALQEVCRIDASLNETLKALEPAEAALSEAGHALRHYLGSLEADPARLDGVESRLAAIEKLRRKYGASVPEILAFLDDVSAKLAALETADERRAELTKKRDRLAEEFEGAASRLREARKKAAGKLEKKVQRELAELAMAGTKFQIQFSPAEWSDTGWDRVDFLIAPNAGEEPKPLERIASGGELSRLALALRTCVEEPRGGRTVMRTLVFDEVDAGIGGAAAEAVGRRLKGLAGANQVLCVTHLAQIAGFADKHFKVEKREAQGRTVAEVEELDPAARTREIGRMLSGQRVTEEALKHAEKLMKVGR